MVDESAKISPKAKIGENVTIGAFSIIEDDVEIGADSVVEPFCWLGKKTALAKTKKLIIGPRAVIRSHTVLYQGSSIGNDFVTGHSVTVREEMHISNGVQLGTLCDLQGWAKIGSYTKAHSNVHIGQGSIIGDYVWLFPYVILTNDPHPPSEVRLGVAIQDYAVVCTQSTILPGVEIGKGALIAAGSIVGKNVAPETLVGGNPAKVFCPLSELRLKDGSEQPAYPWRRHFHRGYPAAMVEKWKEEFSGKK